MTRAEAVSTPARNPRPDGVLVFKPGSKELAAGSIPTIDRLVAMAKSDNANWVRLEACMEDISSSGISVALSQQRIDEIEREMVARGVQPHRIRGISSDDNCGGTERNRIPHIEVRIEKLAY